MQEIIRPFKAYVLEWRPAISSHKMEDFEAELAHFNETWFNWSVWDWKGVETGDEFYLIKCGEAPTGIVMHGVFSSEPYKGEDWSGQGREVYYADLEPDTMIHPERCRLLDTASLEAAMPGFQWNGGQSGRLLPEEYAVRLSQMWEEYLAMNDDFFDNKSAARK